MGGASPSDNVIVSQQALKSYIDNAISTSINQVAQVPVGTIVAFGGTVAPAGWVFCDGSSVLRSTYSNLFTVIGTAFGAADGTHFNVPDLRGMFLRGVDGSANQDPDKAARITLKSGGNAGNNVGSYQANEISSHNHGGSTGGINGGFTGTDIYVEYTDAAGPYNTFTRGVATTVANLIQSHTHSISSQGGNETRPKNVYVNYIIKY